MTSTSPRRKHAPRLAAEGSRKAEILDTAAELFSASGLRTSVYEIADACGILPGSLYHHFESKEEIFVELVARYLADLDRLAEKTRVEHAADARPAPEQVVAFGLAIAECAMRHRAALLLTLYEPPAGASRELVRLVNRAPVAISDVMLAILQRGAADGTIRKDLPLDRVADRVCDVMLHGPTSRDFKARWAERATVKCSLLLHGIAVTPPSDERLDRSSAHRIVDDVVAEWDHEDALETDDKASRIRAVARSEFARRGYELTTIRDVAAAAGVSTGTIYRMVATKDDLLAAIMRRYIERITHGWERILASRSTSVEKLDALLWFNINSVDRFSEEFRIQSLAFQFLPPKSPALNWTIPAQLRRQLKVLVAGGTRSGELQLEGASLDTGARCAFALIWTPEHLVQGGVGAALALDRNLLLRGATPRPR
jgi:AcrR family transcriptional regulator